MALRRSSTWVATALALPLAASCGGSGSHGGGAPGDGGSGSDATTPQEGGASSSSGSSSGGAIDGSPEREDAESPDGSDASSSGSDAALPEGGGDASSGTDASTADAATDASEGGGSSTCAHSECTTGAALASGCDSCVTELCASDSYCCATTWDSQCVSEVPSACGFSCSGSQDGGTADSGAVDSGAGDSGFDTGAGTGPIGPLSTLSFAVIGNTRPPTEDDTAGYPTAIITKIFQDIQAVSPQVPFLVSTGNYQFASPTHTPGTQTAQIDLYVQARASYAGIVLPAMGSMECDSVLTDNCYSCSGTSCSALGGSCAAGVCVTPNYTAFADALLTPVGQTQPYYTIDVNGTNNAWTSKFVFVACNAWSPAQATWLGQQLSVSTTYTFVIRNEGTDATTAPCLTTAPTADTIMAQYPYTLLIAGHTGTYAYYSSDKEVIVGNGGAPLSGAVDYGYVIAQQQASGSIVFTEYDYSTNLAGGTFTVQ